MYTLSHSKRKDKKFVIITPDGKHINFGQRGFEDYTTHHDFNRMRRYEDRHRKREDWIHPTSPGFFSKWILWNKPSLINSIRDTERRFGIKIKFVKN